MKPIMIILSIILIMTTTLVVGCVGESGDSNDNILSQKGGIIFDEDVVLTSYWGIDNQTYYGYHVTRDSDENTVQFIKANKRIDLPYNGVTYRISITTSDPESKISGEIYEKYYYEKIDKFGNIVDSGIETHFLKQIPTADKFDDVEYEYTHYGMSTLDDDKEKIAFYILLTNEADQHVSGCTITPELKEYVNSANGGDIIPESYYEDITVDQTRGKKGYEIISTSYGHVKIEVVGSNEE